MYDDINIVSAGANQPCLFPLLDVGMTGLYMGQCAFLADLADVLGRKKDR